MLSQVVLWVALRKQTAAKFIVDLRDGERERVSKCIFRVPAEIQGNVIRFSTGKFTTMDDIDKAVELICHALSIND